MMSCESSTATKPNTNDVNTAKLDLNDVKDSHEQSDVNSINSIALQPEPCLAPDDVMSLLQEESLRELVNDVPLCPPGMESLLDIGQVVVHKNNFRYPNIKVNESPVRRYEVVDISRKLLFLVEQDHAPFGEDSCLFKIYNKDKKEVAQVLNPGGRTCMCVGLSVHCWRTKRCHFQVMVSSPVGQVVGFIKRTHTCLMQEYEILNNQEELLLMMRGAPVDLEIYTPDLETGLGRLSRQWVGVMREVSRSPEDYGMTFPIDLDVRVKTVLLGVIFSLDWLYSRRGLCR